MSKYESFDMLDDLARDAVVDLLYRLADDELVIGHRGSEWTGLAPILEEDVAFSSIAQDEIGHAQVYYRFLHELGEADPDTLAFARKPREYRCAALVSMPKGDWAFSVLRQFLYDTAEDVRLRALAAGALAPLAQAATKLRAEEKYHLLHGRTWVLRLGRAAKESRQRLGDALFALYPHALGLFEPTEGDQVLARAEISPPEEQLRIEWESAVSPVLTEAGLEVDQAVRPIHGGRVGRQPEALRDLLSGMQLVYNIDPSAKW